MKRLLTLFVLLLSVPSWAATYYVRTDGGTRTQCTGTTDAAYPGSGTGQACGFNDMHWLWTDNASFGAWKSIASMVRSSNVVTVTATGHGYSTGQWVQIGDNNSNLGSLNFIPFFPRRNTVGSSSNASIPVQITVVDANTFTFIQNLPLVPFADGSTTGGTVRSSPSWGWIGSGGDTYVIENNGGTKRSYNTTVTFASPSDWTFCASLGNPKKCGMPPPLSGSDAAHMTTITGDQGPTGCGGHNPELSAPELWGGGGSYWATSIAGTNYVKLQCLDITDHSNCSNDGAVHTWDGSPCVEPPSPNPSEYSQIGLDVHGASNFKLLDLFIHGMGSELGMIQGGYISGTNTVSGVKLFASPGTGWGFTDSGITAYPYTCTVKTTGNPSGFTNVVVAPATNTGTVNTSGTAVTLASGDNFNVLWNNTYAIEINGVPYMISTVNSTTSITLQTSAGTQTGVVYYGGPNQTTNHLCQMNTGTINVTSSGGYPYSMSIGFTGCNEKYPRVTSDDVNSLQYCQWITEADSFSLDANQATWNIDHMYIGHSLSDGFDGVYSGKCTAYNAKTCYDTWAAGPPYDNAAQIHVIESTFEGAGGYNVKFNGNSVSLTSSLINGNCYPFWTNAVANGYPSTVLTYLPANPCSTKSGGDNSDGVRIMPNPGGVSAVYNNTILFGGYAAINQGTSDGYSADWAPPSKPSLQATTFGVALNNLIYGFSQTAGSCNPGAGAIRCPYSAWDTTATTNVTAYHEYNSYMNIFTNICNSSDGSGHTFSNELCTLDGSSISIGPDPGLTTANILTPDINLTSGGAAKYAGTTTVPGGGVALPTTDYNGRSFHNPPSIGAAEFVTGPTCTGSPTLSISSPTSTTYTTLPVTITATATHGTGASCTIASIVIQDNLGNTVCSSSGSTSCSASWNPANGTYSLSGTATDSDGNTAPATVSGVVVSAPVTAPSAVFASLTFQRQPFWLLRDSRRDLQDNHSR